MRQEATEESLIYYYLCILTLDCAANHTNNDPAFKLLCHIFLLAHAVLCSHPLALSRVDISPQCNAPCLMPWYMSAQIMTWAQYLLRHLYKTLNVYSKLSSHDVRQPFNSHLSMVWMKAHSTGILTNLLSCQLTFLIYTSNPFGTLSSVKWGRWHFLLKMLWLWGILCINQWSTLSL